MFPAVSSPTISLFIFIFFFNSSRFFDVFSINPIVLLVCDRISLSCSTVSFRNRVVLLNVIHDFSANEELSDESQETKDNTASLVSDSISFSPMLRDLRLR